MSLSRAGRHLPRWRWPRLFGLLITMIAALYATPVTSASASSGGTAIPAPAPKQNGNSHPSRPVASPLNGRGMWIWYVSASSHGNLSSIISTVRAADLSTLMIKSGDGATMWSQFNSRLVTSLHHAGLKVCAWQYVYGAHPVNEAQVGAAAVRAGADCLLIDAESEYEGRYVQAQTYLTKLRALIGSRYLVALAGFPYVDYHPGFPYSVFLGPGGAQYNVPQMYWSDIGTSVDAVYAHTFDFNAPYQRPIEPLGEVSGNPAPRQVLRFRQLSRAYGAAGVSWWDWQESSGRDWSAIGQPVGNLSGFTAQSTPPLLTPNGQGGISSGDLVVWAQEHLVSAGDPVQIDGLFGPDTQTAVLDFQTARGLPATGLVDPPTWQALLTYRPVAVTWVRQQKQTVAVIARADARDRHAALRLAVPRSARLPARRDEIPRDLGAGAQAP